MGNCQLSQFFLPFFLLPFYYPSSLSLNLQTSISTDGISASTLTLQHFTLQKKEKNPDTSVKETDIMWAVVSCTQNHRKVLLIGWDEVSRLFLGSTLWNGATPLFYSGTRAAWCHMHWNDRLPYGIRDSVIDSCLRGLVPVTTSNFAPLTQSLINRRKK